MASNRIRRKKRCNVRRFTGCMSVWVRRWCRLRATKCRSLPVRHPQRASAHTGSGRAVRRVPYGAGVSHRAGLANDGAGARDAGSGGYRGPQAWCAALHAVAERQAAAFRRPDGDAARRGRRLAVPGGERLAQGRRLRPHREPLARRHHLRKAEDQALLALQGPAAVRAGTACTRCGGSCLHDRRAHAIRRHGLPYFPLGLHRRGRLRDFHCCRACRSHGSRIAGRAGSARPSASAPATRCGWKRASASTATTSTRPPRRLRPGWRGPSASAAARMAASPARIASCASLKDGPPRRRVGLLLDGRAAARENADIFDGAAASSIGHVTSGAFSAQPRPPHRHGLRRSAVRRARHAALPLVIRGTPHPAASCPMPFVPHGYIRKPKLKGIAT